MPIYFGGTERTSPIWAEKKNLHSIYGTQGLAELEKVEKTFRQQMMNCVNTLICHRLNDHDVTEQISKWVGTEDQFKFTAQVTTVGESSMGSVRTAKVFYLISMD